MICLAGRQLDTLISPTRGNYKQVHAGFGTSPCIPPIEQRIINMIVDMQGAPRFCRLVQLEVIILAPDFMIL